MCAMNGGAGNIQVSCPLAPLRAASRRQEWPKSRLSNSAAGSVPAYRRTEPSGRRTLVRLNTLLSSMPVPAGCQCAPSGLTNTPASCVPA
jgi:hypothetical protein